MYEQTEMDLRLDYEITLKDNLINVTKFVEEQIKREAERNGTGFQTVANAQEAYGISAQAYVKVTMAQKMLKGAMDDFLKLLDSEGDVVQMAGVVYAAALALAEMSIMMAASESRILSDLYRATPRTPVEDYLDAAAAAEAEKIENNGGEGDE